MHTLTDNYDPNHWINLTGFNAQRSLKSFWQRPIAFEWMAAAIYAETAPAGVLEYHLHMAKYDDPPDNQFERK